ncbi:biotin transporter BioY [Pararhizobium haloflavum]|uniref:biotin transporter BioY n=1 Tax=Pararhizobium haloflavum TaxID=2037914 RepID=UPI000C17BE5C|nr:biotin transporter BioY [Pararhizobium haloflavum]
MSTRDIVHIALFAAFTAALGLFPPVTLPLTGVPITAQSMGPMLAGAIIGARKGFLSQALLLVLVAAGLPLLAGGRGGFGVFLGPTGGFLLGWAISAWLIGWLFERNWRNLTALKATAYIFIGGIPALYLIGTAWVAVVVDLSYMQALLANAPFVAGDLVKVAIATIVAMTVRRAYPMMARA